MEECYTSEPGRLFHWTCLGPPSEALKQERFRLCYNRTNIKPQHAADGAPLPSSFLFALLLRVFTSPRLVRGSNLYYLPSKRVTANEVHWAFRRELHVIHQLGDLKQLLQLHSPCFCGKKMICLLSRREIRSRLADLCSGPLGHASSCERLEHSSTAVS